MKQLLIAAVLFSVGCNSLVSPSGINVKAMRAWAVAHVLEACVTIPPSTQGTLVSLGSQTGAGMIVQPISYCNPAE